MRAVVAFALLALALPFAFALGIAVGFHLREEAAQCDEHAVYDRVQCEAVEEREEVVNLADLVAVGVHDDVFAADDCFALRGFFDNGAAGEVFAFVEEQFLERRVVDRVAGDVQECADDGADQE